MVMEYKICKICHENKPFSDFYMYSSSHKYRKSRCKACESKIAKDWYNDNRESYIEQKKKYQKTYVKSISARYTCLVSAAKIKGYENTITYNQYKSLIRPGECFYCPNGLVGNGYCIDRADPNGDYSISNVVPCCAKCNYMKQNLGLSDFITHVKQIAAKKGKSHYASTPTKTIWPPIRLGKQRVV